MSQAILNNAKLCNVATVTMTPILQDLRVLTRLVELNLHRLRKAAEIAIRFAEFHGLTYYKPVAGLYIWIRLSQSCNAEAEEEAIVKACAVKGALVGSGADYTEPQPGWFRITFALPQDVFLDGLGRIEEAMGFKNRFKFPESRTIWGAAVASCWRMLST